MDSTFGDDYAKQGEVIPARHERFAKQKRVPVSP
jgi:hypothetical protein